MLRLKPTKGTGHVVPSTLEHDLLNIRYPRIPLTYEVTLRVSAKKRKPKLVIIVYLRKS